MLAGSLGVLTLFLAAGAALSLLPSAVAIPIAVASAAVAVVAKVFGMAALFLLVMQPLAADTVARRGRELAVVDLEAAVAAHRRSVAFFPWREVLWIRLGAAAHALYRQTARSGGSSMETVPELN